MNICRICRVVLTEQNRYRNRLFCIEHGREYQNKAAKKYIIKHYNEVLEKNREWSEKAIISGYYRQLRRRLRLKVLSHYSNASPPQCADPYHIHGQPFTILEALSLDHIQGNGTEERKSKGSGDDFYRWLIKNNYPVAYQVLCANCNTIKRYRNQEWRNQYSRGKPL